MGENQALSDFQDMPDVQNGNDTVDMESGFTDESDSFGSNGRDSSVGSDFQSLASVEERRSGQRYSNCGRISEPGRWYYGGRKAP